MRLDAEEWLAVFPSLLWKQPFRKGQELPLPTGAVYRVEADDIMLPITLHSLRHTFASVLIFEGVNMKTVSAVLGHESVAFTYDVYGHLLPGSVDKAAKAIERAMGQIAAR